MKIYPNLASTKMQQLISLLSDLEHTDRQRMSSDGQEALDNIFELLGMPKYDDVIRKSEEEE
jgi:hypothetical protein|tara:strand:+ start:1250 stop:1435 length:186 start_codon:yes stop_codon:yes gene_type:complete